MKRSALLIIALLMWTDSSNLFAKDSEATLSRITGQVKELPESTTAIIFLCDAKTGLPVKREESDKAQKSPDWKQYRHALTGQNGRFDFKDVRPGTYRLFAQSWKGLQGLPESLITKTEDEFTIHGTVERVVVPSEDSADGTAEVIIKPIGNETIEILPTPDEGGAFLLISRGKTIGNPAMGYIGWGDEFLSGLCLFVCMSKSSAIIHGLPDDETMVLSAIFYDNNPGFGGTEFKAPQKQVNFYVVAGWSNGHKEPPTYLKKLTDAFVADAELSESIPDLIGFKTTELLAEFRKHPSPQKTWDSLGGAKRIVNVPGVGKYSVIDIVAAEGFTRLKKMKR